ncbi:MAG: signal peptidase II [Chloroflexi bacterium]|nr:signal peptidase II [Chloroflexota bacterium]
MTGSSRGRPHWGPFVTLVALIVAIDQATKAWIANELSGGRTIVFLDGALRLVYSRNDGALFGLFQGQVAIFALLSLAAIALIVMFHARSGRSRYMTLTLGLLLGGAIGNAIDRFRLGYVIDFVDGGLGTARFFTFNVADACISGAIVLLLAMALRPSLVREADDHATGTPADGSGEPGPATQGPASGG